MRTLFSLLLCTMLVASCSFFKRGKQNDPSETYSTERQKMETAAAAYLNKARTQLSADSCAAARATIKKMRKDCYLAITARNEGIVLMDSVDLREAKNELARIDSLMRTGSNEVGTADFEEACRKVQFYERKIQHDRPH